MSLAFKIGGANGALITSTTNWNFNAAYTWLYWWYNNTGTDLQWQSHILHYNPDPFALGMDSLFQYADPPGSGDDQAYILRAQIAGYGDHVDGAAISLARETWHPLALMRVDASTLRAYRGDVLLATATLDISSRGSTTQHYHGDGATTGNGAVAFSRVWTAALSTSELLTEFASRVAVRTSNLYKDTPLQGNLLDISGNGRHWSYGGTGSPIWVPGPHPDLMTRTLRRRSLRPGSPFSPGTDVSRLGRKTVLS